MHNQKNLMFCVKLCTVCFLFLSLCFVLKYTMFVNILRVIFIVSQHLYKIRKKSVFKQTSMYLFIFEYSTNLNTRNSQNGSKCFVLKAKNVHIQCRQKHVYTQQVSKNSSIYGTASIYLNFSSFL